MNEISIDLLKNVKALEQYIKNVNFLGLNHKKQFEEYFTTLLLLLNQDIDLGEL